jgi:hypothetical protein
MKQLFTLTLLCFLGSVVSFAAPLKEVHQSTKSYENIKSIEINGDFCKVILTPSADNQTIVSTFIEASKDIEGFGINDKTEADKLSLSVAVPSEHVSTKSGEIKLQIPEGTKVKIKTASGYIEAIDTKECEVDAYASYGRINARNVSGNYTFKTSTGGITVQGVNGELYATTTGGEIEISDVDGQSTVVTDKGPVTLKNISGKLTTQSNTSAQNLTNINGDIMLRTSTGELTLNSIKGTLETANDDGDVWITDFEGTMHLISIAGNLVGEKILLTGNTYFETTKGRVEMEFRNDLNELTFDLASNYGFLYIPGKSKKKKLKSGNGPIAITTSTNDGAQRFSIVNE